MNRHVWFISWATNAMNTCSRNISIVQQHVARRTFVVTALYLGIPAEVIMRYTGHSSFSAMKPYVAIVDELKRKSMDLFDGI